MREHTKFLYKEHGIILFSGYQQVIISQSHQKIQLATSSSCGSLFSEEPKHVLLQVGVVEAGQNVRDTESLRYALDLPELLLVKSDIVVATYLDNRVK